MNPSLTRLDIFFLAAYFAVVIVKGIQVARNTKSDEDLFLAGRSLTFGLIGFSLFASNISSTTLIGLAGSAYETGIAVANYEWMAGLILVFMSFTFVPIYLRARITTVPEFLEIRFDSRTRKYFSAITLFLTVFVDTAGGLYAGALALQIFFPGISLWHMVVGVALFCGAYTAAGGLRAVVHTDLIQAIVLLIGASWLTVQMFAQFDFDWSFIANSLPEGHLELFKSIDDPVLPGWGTLTGVPILGFWYWVTNQYIVQRVLGAQNESQARFGAILGGFLKILPLFVMVIPGAIARLHFPGLNNSDMVFPVMVGQLLPSGIVGLVLAGLLAAVMSSIDSALNSCSTLIIYDFMSPEVRQDPVRALKLGRITTFAFMVVAAVWAPMIGEFAGLFAYLQQAFAIAVPPVVAIFLLGVFSRIGDGTTALATLVFGHLFAGALFLLQQLGVWTLHFTITAALVTASSVIVYLALCLLAKRPSPSKINHTVFVLTMTKPPAGTPWFLDYRLYAVMVLMATGVTVAAFA